MLIIRNVRREQVRFYATFTNVFVTFLMILNALIFTSAFFTSALVTQLTVACVAAWRKYVINLFEVARLIILY